MRLLAPIFGRNIMDTLISFDNWKIDEAIFMKQGWIITYGDMRHYVDGNIHNDNGPAIIWVDGSKFWCKNDKLHRQDGPAIEYANGPKEWWYDNKLIGKSINGFYQAQLEGWLRFTAFL